jgi:uncharacterized protein YyaL (SSP411 family)
MLGALGAAHAQAAPDAWSSAHRAAVNEHRAVVTYGAMQRHWYIARRELYRGNPYATAWTYGQVVAATFSVASMPRMRAQFRKDVRARLRAIELYADRRSAPPAGYLSKVAPPHGPGGDVYNDDNAWYGIELARARHVFLMPTLYKARSVFAMIGSSWGMRAFPRCPGGIPWAPTVNGDRNTVSNAPTAELGLQLYFRTGDRGYIDQAQRMYEWVRTCMLAPNGLYWDHISPRGVIDRKQWTYNQGTMIGAGVMLYQATHDRSYLDQAVFTANAALRLFSWYELDRQPDYFDAIYIRNLLLLASATRDQRYRDFAQRFAAREWRRDRDDRSGLFRGHRGQEQLLDQAAMTQIYAMLVARPRTYF